MTEQEKQYIIEQRALGESFVQIGKALGRKEDAVRVAFHRMNAKETDAFGKADGTEMPGSNFRCKYCGRLFEKSSAGAKRLFCSDRCRNAWCNERKRRIPYQRRCEYCGQMFTAFGNPNRRFCSRQCFADSCRKGGERKEGPCNI